ncbi:MAG: hypothetical protein KKD00_07400 [Gammaproteobacteria bacterium]|nr:hypothetical protein [Gammaproteobacteria bacterium]
MNQSPELQPPTPFKRLVQGHYGLALTYWVLYLVVAAIFFIAGSAAVAGHDWPRYLTLLAATLVWTFVLLIGIQRAYKGEDPGKALGRIAMLFLLLNMTNALATLSFI